MNPRADETHHFNLTPLDPEGASVFCSIPCNWSEEEQLAADALLETANMMEDEELQNVLDVLADRVSVNASRELIQIMGCDGQVAAQAPVSGERNAQLSRWLADNASDRGRH